jgi:uncharacterized protein
MKKRQLLPFLLLCAVALTAVTAQNIPAPQSPPRLVNDFAELLSPREAATLENRLVALSDSTSVQICIVTIMSLDGYDVSDYAQRLGEQWGAGQKQYDNGIVVLVKSKTGDSRGEVAIATGYGLEGAIPDITCSQIIDYEILPAFRENNYYGGLNNAVNILASLAAGEFPASEYGKRGEQNGRHGIPTILKIILILVILGILGKSRGSNNRHLSSGSLPLWLLLDMMNSGGSHKGSWGGFSGGGGFGGFGGGSFGGGGASGSW